MEYSEQVVAVLAESVVKTVKGLLAEYGVQINQKLQNIKITGDNIKPLSIGVGALATGAVTGQNIQADSVGSLHIKDGAIDAAKINNLTAEVMNAVIANIATANIDWANIERLEAATAEISKATVGQLTADDIKATNLEATIAELGLANINSAKIQFGQIMDAALENAIITEGVGGKLFISRLAVTEANMVSLATGTLMIKDKEGKFCQLVIDEDGNVTAVPVPIVGDDIAEGAITGDNLADGSITGDKIGDEAITGSNIAHAAINGDHLIAGAITAREVNASQLFANEALMVELTANMGKFANLFANEAVIEQLRVHLVESDYMKVLIRDNVDVGGRNLVLKSGDDVSNQDYVIARYDFGTMPPLEGETVAIRVKGALGQGKSTFGIYNSGTALRVCNLVNNGDGTFTATVPWVTAYTDTTGATQTVDNTHIVVVAQEAAVTGVTSAIDWIKVERGNKATDHTLAPEDTDATLSDLAAKVEKTAELIMDDDSIAQRVTQSEYFKEVIDSSIAYRVDIRATSDILSSAIPQVEIYATVWHGSTNVTDEIDASRFIWTRTSQDPTADELWNKNHIGLKRFMVTAQDVWYSATYTCEISTAEE